MQSTSSECIEVRDVAGMPVLWLPAIVTLELGNGHEVILVSGDPYAFQHAFRGLPEELIVLGVADLSKMPAPSRERVVLLVNAGGISALDVMLGGALDTSSGFTRLYRFKGGEHES